MSDRGYTFDAQLRIWRTSAHDSFAYSDGDEVERYLLNALQKCRDLSSTSEELRQYIIDWPSEYHFSPQRQALLRPFSISPGDRVLELGCGCGAITRYLGETGATVVAVEGSRVRAQIAAERCRDLPNVEVYCDNLVNAASSESFDLVTLIGVLEYAPSYVDHHDPLAECLRRAADHLNAKGQLLIAIENQLGLKYFAGCTEDHIGKAFLGIEDLYAGRQAVTLGRQALSNVIARAGLHGVRWYYPFPDYKLPRMIISEAGINAADIDLATLLVRSSSRDYGDHPWRCFDEILARRSVWENGLLAELANSFLLTVKQGEFAEPRCAEFLAKGFNLSRRSSLCTETDFTRGKQGDITVTRRPLLSVSPPDRTPQRFQHQLNTERYVHGRLLVEHLHQLARSDWSIESLVAWATPWVAELQRHVYATHPPQLPPNFLDFTPFNAVQTSSGAIAYIDAEWCADQPIPLTWVIIRGISHSLTNVMRPLEKTASRRALIIEITNRLGIALSESDFVAADQWETALQKQVCGGPASFSFSAFLEQPIGENISMAGAIEESRAALATTLDSFHKTLDSRSWRLTKPLRDGQLLLSRMTKSRNRD